MVHERRKFTRYLVQSDAYAALGSSFTKVGKIKDVSVGGVAFEYIDSSKDAGGPPPYKVSLFMTGDKFFLWHLPCRIIHDELTDEHMKSSLFYVHRQCGIQFTDLDENQRQNLEYFLTHHTCGLVSSSITNNNPM